MNKLLIQFINDTKNLKKIYNELIRLTSEHKYVGTINEWLIDNYFLVNEQERCLKPFLKSSDCKKVMRKKEHNLYHILQTILEENEFQVEQSFLVRKLNLYQRQNKYFFTYKEINMILPFTISIVIDRLNKLMKKEYSKIKDKEKVDKLMEQIEKERLEKGMDHVKLSKFISITPDIINHPVYLEHLNYQLRELGENTANIFRELNEVLEKQDLILKDILNEEHIDSAKDNILISHLFEALRNSNKIKIETLYNKISKTEKLLLEDPLYKDFSLGTKANYRGRILTLAKKKHQPEYLFAQELMRQAKENNQHFGFQLFKQSKSNWKTILYTGTITLLTTILSFWLSAFLGINRSIAFLILIVPISELIIQCLNKLLISIIPTKTLPKYNFASGIPKEYATMVIIPTILNNKETVLTMFENLETYYLSNKSANLYFTLLGDCKEIQTKDFALDDEIVKTGIQKCKELNQKYNKNIFYFVYRNRFYNKSEGSYLGYERKRGAILHFNNLLLDRYSEEEKQKWFRYQNIDKLNANIKYIVTLDRDTRIVLNTIQKLVGTMAHPLNKPTLDKQKRKVISGYAMMQPRVSIDIESTNKSIYSQLFAGLGGLDVYTRAVADFYQDVFQEGFFAGKGIYDLEIFQTVLEKAFPTNQILSHDMLEGNYLRCASVTDVEIIDDYPSKFLSDITRQERWTRGDYQIINWLFPTVKTASGHKVKNPLNLLSQWKLLDNIRRSLNSVSLLLLLLVGFSTSTILPLYWFLLILLVIFLPIIFYLGEKIKYRRHDEVSVKYYKTLVIGSKAVLFKSIIIFCSIPYNAYTFTVAGLKGLYRTFISHKHLLNWITAEDAEKNTKGDLKTYLKSFLPNYVFAFILILASTCLQPEFLLSSILLGICFIIAPILLYLVSLDIDIDKKELSQDKQNNLKELAFRTWNYFDTLLKEENNYLIPDNYQLNRERKEDDKTSPTDISMSLLAIISAYELSFIGKDKALFLTTEIITSIEKLKKWNGHLYNWYNIQTMEPLHQYFISSVDSANLVAALITMKEFVQKQNDQDLAGRIETLIDQADFSKLYSKRNVFSIGYNLEEHQLSVYNYNNFASESRIISLVAIAKGDVKNSHWFSLDKTLTKHKKYKGLVSWSGTSFEYFMPLIFCKTFPNTLLDESYFFAYYCQKDYMNSIDKKMPWGISESAYSELDDCQNYKYQAFGTPYLKLQEDINSRVVLSPYSSIMAITKIPEEVYQNIRRFKRLNMYGDYGLYEAYDYDNKTNVYAYFAHHQGMILSSLTNYLKENAIQDYFHDDIRIKAFDILLKEKIQIKPYIDMKMSKYKKYNYERENIENDIRAYNHISLLPEISVLSNGKYTVLLNDRGNGFSRYNTLQLNRYRKITEQDYGMFLYIKDLSKNKIWSNTYAPMNITPDNYTVVFASDRIKYIREDSDTTTTTEITVTKNLNAEIRKITIQNKSEETKYLELTSYTEPILAENPDDIAHRVFNSIFIQSEFDESTNSVILKKSHRSKPNTDYYMINKMVILEEDIPPFEYETNRTNFIGRNQNTDHPQAVFNQERLTNSVGTVLDPVVSIRNQIIIEPEKEKTIYLIQGFGTSRTQVIDIVNTYQDQYAIDNAFTVATVMNTINTKRLNLSGHDMRIYNMMLNYLYQTSKLTITDQRNDILKQNKLTQSHLWKFGISGSHPTIVVDISDISDLGLVRELLKAFEYLKTKGIFTDIVIINSENEGYEKTIEKEVNDELYRIESLNYFNDLPGNVYLIKRSEITEDEIILLNMVARLRFNTINNKSLEEYIMDLQNQNIPAVKTNYRTETAKRIRFNKKELDFYNEYGGFKNNGTEYLITNKDTPTPWVNVIANEQFGTIVTNNACGFTYADNSREFKLTSWTNDMVVNDKSEGIKIGNRLFDPTVALHGFGYSTFYNATDETNEELTEFVATTDPVKFYLLKLKNKTTKTKTINLSYWMNPTLGVSEETTSRHILTETNKKENCLILQNIYIDHFQDKRVFLSCSHPIKKFEGDKVLTKSIDTSLTIKPGHTETVVFLLGCTDAIESVYQLRKKYSTIESVEQELETVKTTWKKRLQVIQVETPDKAFDFMLNGWYLYQTMASRLFAKSGFYQVGGAFGYRDQLQDAINIVTIHPALARKQILINANHQFHEGDVLHWWHKELKFGIRTKFKDDFLWLVYATIQYVKSTKDTSILKEQIGFVEGVTLEPWQEELGFPIQYSTDTASLLDHCKLALNKSLNELGSHGLPLMGGGDWNDGMNKVGIEGKGESVWLGFFLYDLLINVQTILPKKDPDKTRYLEAAAKLKDNLNQHAWDGEYYLRAFFDNGHKLGSIDNKECRIDLISQSFSILTDVADKQRQTQVEQEIESQLVDHDQNIIKLLTPAFENSKDDPGYIMKYPKGIRENGGQYTHASFWYILALSKLRQLDKTFEYYQMLNPITRTKSKKELNIYKVEPYVLAADIYASKDHPGRGGWTWYTGSAGWAYKVGIENILGFQKQGDQLEINPCIPSTWKKYKIDYHYMDTLYHIEIINANQVKKTITMDKIQLEDNKIPLINDKQVHNILVKLD